MDKVLNNFMILFNRLFNTHQQNQQSFYINFFIDFGSALPVNKTSLQDELFPYRLPPT